MAERQLRDDDKSLSEYVKVNEDEIDTAEQPDSQTVNLSTTTIYAKHVVNVKDSKHVQVHVETPITNTPIHQSFNALHGNEVQIDQEKGTTAKRLKGFKHGICFANTSFRKSSSFHVKITDTFEDSFGRCRMGFTNRDPQSLRGSGILRKGIETAKCSEGFFVIEPSMDTCAYSGAVIYFSFSNEVVTFCSSKDGASQTFHCPGVFRSGDDLWAFIELGGPVREVEVENNSFHEVCGTVAQVKENVASPGWWYTLGYEGGLVCFTKDPIPHDKPAEFKLSKVNVNSAGHIRVGIVKENPDLIRPETLPSTIIAHHQYQTMEVAGLDAKCGNTISLIALASQICVVINSNKQIGVITPDKDIDKLWAVVELYGKIKAVEIISPPDERCQTSERHLEKEKNRQISQQMCLVSEVWLESQNVMNTLKAVADSIVYYLEGPGSYWNSALIPVQTAAAYVGLDDYVKMAEVGDAPEILRTELPSLVNLVTNFVSHTDNIKISVGSLDSKTLCPGQSEQFKLLRSIAAKLPSFHLKLPGRSPMSPPPDELLLNLTPLPTEADDPRDWQKLVVVKTLLEIANKIEAAFHPIDDLIRKLYVFGI